MKNTNQLLQETEKLLALSETVLNLDSLELKTDFPMNELYIQLGHSDSIVSVDISPDGKYMVSGSLDKTIRLWDIESGEELKTFDLYDNEVSGSENSIDDRIYSVTITADGKSIISESNNSGLVFDIESGAKIDSQMRGSYESEMLKRINSKVNYISYCSNYFELIDFFTEEVIQTFRDKTYIQPKQQEYEEDMSYYFKGAGDREMDEEKEFEAYCSSVSVSSREFYDNLFIFTSDDKYIVSVTSNHTLSLWDIESGEQLKVFSRHNNTINSIAITPNEKYIISGSSDGNIKLWDIESGEELKTFIGHKNSINTLSVTSDGKYIISGSADNTLKLWDIEIGEELRSFGNKLLNRKKINNISISLDGKYIFSTSALWFEDEIFIKDIWDMLDEKYLIHKVDSDFCSLNKYCTENNIQLLNADDEKSKTIEFNKEKELNPSFVEDKDMHYMAISNKYIVSGGRGDVVILWDRKSLKELKTFKKYFSNKNKVGISKNEKYVFSYDDTNNIKVVWDIETEETLENFESWNNYEVNVSISPNHKYLISLNRDSSIKIWNIETKEVLIYFIVLSDKEWIVWTGDGYYNCSDGAMKYISFLNNTDSLPTIIDRENRIYKDRKKDNLFSLVLHNSSGNILC